MGIRNQNEMAKELGNRLKAIQDRLGYSNEEMADILCVATGHYRKILLGYHVLTTDKLLILTSDYGVNANYYLNGTGPILSESNTGICLEQSEMLQANCKSFIIETYRKLEQENREKFLLDVVEFTVLLRNT